MNRIDMRRWMAAASLCAVAVSGVSAQKAAQGPRGGRPAPGPRVVLTDTARATVQRATVDFSKLPVEQRIAAARELERQLMDSLTPEQREKVRQTMGPRGPRRGPRGMDRPGGPPPDGPDGEFPPE